MPQLRGSRTTVERGHVQWFPVCFPLPTHRERFHETTARCRGIDLQPSSPTCMGHTCGWRGHHALFHVVPPSVRSPAYRSSIGRLCLAINLLPFLHLPSRLRNCTGNGHSTHHTWWLQAVRRASTCDAHVAKRRCRREMASAWTKFHQEGAIVGAGAISRAEAEDLASRLRVAEREVRRVRFRSDA